MVVFYCLSIQYTQYYWSLFFVRLCYLLPRDVMQSRSRLSVCLPDPALLCDKTTFCHCSDTILKISAVIFDTNKLLSVKNVCST